MVDVAILSVRFAEELDLAPPLIQQPIAKHKKVTAKPRLYALSAARHFVCGGP